MSSPEENPQLEQYLHKLQERINAELENAPEHRVEILKRYEREVSEFLEPREKWEFFQRFPANRSGVRQTLGKWLGYAIAILLTAGLLCLAEGTVPTMEMVLGISACIVALMAGPLIFCWVVQWADETKTKFENNRRDGSLIARQNILRP